MKLYLRDGERYRVRLMDAREVIGVWRSVGRFEVNRGTKRRALDAGHVASVKEMGTHWRHAAWVPLDDCYDAKHAPAPTMAAWVHPYRRAA